MFDNIEEATKENPYVLILVCSLAGIYLLLIIPIRGLDIRDYKMVRNVFVLALANVLINVWDIYV